MTRFKSCIGVAVLGAAALSATPVTAQTSVPMARITAMWNAWGLDSLAINLDTPALSGGCPVAGVYVTDPASAQNKLVQSMLLSAHMARRKVSVTVSGCHGGQYPIILNVSIEP